jgi:hypothetical protein
VPLRSFDTLKELPEEVKRLRAIITRLEAECSRHVEYLYALKCDRGGKTGLCYLMGPRAQEVWDQVIELEYLGIGHTRRTLELQGYYMVRVRVEEVRCR